MSALSVEDIATAIRARHAIAHPVLTGPVLTSPVLIAIEGFGGAGKSTLAAALASALGDAAVIGMDDFIVKEAILDPSWEAAYDRGRLERQVLVPARSGAPIRYQRLLWAANELSAPIEVAPVAFLIVEGISAYHPDVARYYDVKVWVDTPIELARERGRARDAGNENAQHWDLWAANDLAYRQERRPELMADFVAAGG